MTSRQMTDAELIAAYRLAAPLRRANSILSARASGALYDPNTIARASRDDLAASHGNNSGQQLAVPFGQFAMLCR